MNSTVRPIFNENFVEKKDLWVLWIVHETHWQTHSSKNFTSQRDSESCAQCMRPVDRQNPMWNALLNKKN